MHAAEIIRELRVHEETSDTRIVIVSGSPPGTLRLTDESLTHLTKPFRMKQILALLDEAFGAPSPG